jgi:4-amino-4-deoxy-L-arabinose transferase-like glycosyltransferase
LALGLRFLFLAAEPEARIVGDEATWTAWGREIASPEVHFSPAASRILFYPPGYPYFIAVGWGLFGSLAAVRVLQVLVSALLVPAIGRLGARLWNERAGSLAACFTAAYPDLVWFTTHFWAETLFLTLVFWGLERLVAARQEGRRDAALLAGLLWGAAALTREPALYFVPLGALWLGLEAARRRAALAFVLAAFATVVPWTLRNRIVYDAFVPVSTFGPFNLWLGNTPETREEVYAEYARVPGRIAKYRYTQERALEAIRARQPWWIFEKLRSELPRFFEADSQALAHLRRGAYGAVPAAVLALATLVFVLPYLASLALFVRGLARAPLGRDAALLLAFAGYYVLLHVAALGFARFRLPIVPVLLLFGAAAFATPAVSSARRRAVAAAAGLGLVLCVLPSLRERVAGEAAAPGEAAGPQDASAP